MDEIKNGVIETQSVPDNVERLVKLDIKNGKASATLFANPNGSKIKQRLEALETRFNNLKTINKEELYGPGNIDIKGGSGDTELTKAYVDNRDEATLVSAKSYTDTAVSNLRDYADKAASDALEQAKDYADALGGGSSGGNVVLIDAVGRAAQARVEAYNAFNSGKAIVMRVDKSKYIPMTAVSSDSTNTSVDLKGFEISYSGYDVTPNVTLVTRIWTLNANGLTYVEKSLPINSCRTFDCTVSNTIANTFSNAISAYNEGVPVILKVGVNTFVLATTVNSTSLAGYSFMFKFGTTDGQMSVASVDITRWLLTKDGLSKDVFNVGSGGGGTGGSITIDQYYSTNTVASGLPQNPDDNPTFWNQTSQTSASVWAAMRSTGNDWVIWKLQPKDGTNGNGISSLTKRYGVSDSSTVKPTVWTSTMPNANQGQYIWCEVTINYTTGASPDVYYTVSYIGKDGIDGSDGTSVKIINTLSSKEDLPTSGRENGDGYLIDGDLWVYNGNSITSDTTYRGFTNVGKIQGPTGKTPCVHIAWCNGDPSKGDYTGFDVDAPDGSLFDYMGTYVDYKDSPDTVCPDPTEPSLYTWTKIRGKDGNSAIQVDLTCECDEIPLTYDGVVARTTAHKTYIGMFEGREPIEITEITYTKSSSDISVVTAVSGGITNYPGSVTVLVNSGATGIEMGANRIILNVTGKCLDGTKTHKVRVEYVLIGVKAGEPGEDVTTYELDVTPDVVKKFADGSFDADNVSCCLYKLNGSERTVSTDGTLRYSIDGKAEVDTVNNYGVSVNNITNRIEFKFYLNNNLRLTRKVLVLADGATGETPKIVSTKYQYAVAMSFTNTPNDLTAWTDEPFEVEPGQYLYIKTIRTWSNGDVTYDFSWIRGGLNGYSNLPFVSTVFTRSTTTPNKPVGGSYLSPVPDGWSDGVPTGSAKLWMSTRKFTADGLAPQESEWTTPESALSSSTMNIRYASTDECPKDPDVATSGVWGSTPDENSIWGAFQIISGGVKKPWELRKIKGEGSIIDNTSAATPFMGEWDSSTPYYGTKTRTDIVRVSGQSGSSQEQTYYYIANKAKGFDGVITPKPGTTAGDAYWLRFGANFDNIATGFLFSEKIGADIITAINASIDKIDAKNINVDNIVASKVKTADTGTRILIEDNKLTAYDYNNQYLFRLDPGFSVDNNYTMEASYNTYKLPSLIVVGTVSGATTKTTVRKIVVDSFSALSGKNAYVSNIGVRNLKYKVKALYLEYGDVVTADIYMTFDGDIFAKKSIEIRDDMCDYVYPDSMISIPINPIESEYAIEAFANISIKLGSSASSRIQPPMVEVSVEKDTEIVSFYTYGLIIGNNGLRSGSIPLNKKVFIDATSDNIFSAETERFGLKVNNGLFVKTPSTGVYDALRNPVVIDVQKDLPDGYVDNEIMLRMRNAILDGIPVFFKSLVSYNFGNGNEVITVMWNISEMYSTGQSFSSGQLSFYSSVRLRSLSTSNPSIDNPDYFIANLFIKGVTTKTHIADTPFDGFGSIIVNIERMYNTDYSKNVTDLISRVSKLEEWRDSHDNS